MRVKIKIKNKLEGNYFFRLEGPYEKKSLIFFFKKNNTT